MQPQICTIRLAQKNLSFPIPLGQTVVDQLPTILPKCRAKGAMTDELIVLSRMAMYVYVNIPRVIVGFKLIGNDRHCEGKTAPLLHDWK